VETFLHDLKYSLRMFWQSRGFTAAAVAALGLGIGVNTAIFSVVNAVLLKPIPFPDPDRIVMFMNTSPQGSGPAASPAKFQHWRQQKGVVEDVSAYRTGIVNYTGGGLPEQLHSAQVSADYFRLFGAPIIRGRTFTAEEDFPDGPHVVVLSYAFWSRRFAGDRQMLGKTISLSGDPYVVIGVVGPSFDISEFGPPPDVFVPFQLDPNTKDQGHYFTAAGRLKPGIPLGQAQARLRLSAEEFRRIFPNALQKDQSFSVEPFQQVLVRNVRPLLAVLLAAVGFVLLIACANVANLLLARAVNRRRELAVRAAMGAGRGRIVRQLLTESVLLSLAGAILGSALGLIGIRALLSVNTANLPRVGANGSLVSVDWRILLFTLAIAILTGILFGLIPAVHASRTDLSASLKESSGRSGSGFRQNKARTLLVVSEIALAVILLVGAALLIRTTVALADVSPGFDPTHVLTMRMSLTGPQYVKSSAVDLLVRETVDRLRALPGVVLASATCCVPLEGGYGLPFIIEGRPLTDGPFHGGGGWMNVSPGYFDVYKIPVLRGRTFSEREGGGATPVVIINQAMAKQYWPKSDPLSDKIWIGKGVMREFAAETPRQIIGVVGDVRPALNVPPQPIMYVPTAQVPDLANALNLRLTPIAWVLRTRGDPASMSAPVQEQLRQITGLPVSEVRTMDDVIARSISRQRFNMLLMSVFGGAALLLAAIGIYGLMAYSVQQRTQEIGIRIALGAESQDVRRMVLFQGMRLAIVGVLVGIGAAFGLTRMLTTFLFGVQPRDPLVFTSIPSLLTLVALLAVWMPSIRATRVDPVVALRYE
jgi:putative ABC transport system permease protein